MMQRYIIFPNSPNFHLVFSTSIILWSKLNRFCNSHYKSAQLWFIIHWKSNNTIFLWKEIPEFLSEVRMDDDVFFRISIILFFYSHFLICWPSSTYTLKLHTFVVTVAHFCSDVFSNVSLEWLLYSTFLGLIKIMYLPIRT